MVTIPGSVVAGVRQLARQAHWPIKRHSLGCCLVWVDECKAQHCISSFNHFKMSYYDWQSCCWQLVDIWWWIFKGIKLGSYRYNCGFALNSYTDISTNGRKKPGPCCTIVIQHSLDICRYCTYAQVLPHSENTPPWLRVLQLLNLLKPYLTLFDSWSIRIIRILYFIQLLLVLWLHTYFQYII